MLSNNAIYFLQMLGVTITVALFTVFLAELVSEWIARIPAYSVFIPMALIAIAVIGFSTTSGFGIFWGTIWKWQAIAAPVSLYTHLVARHLNETHGTSYVKTYFLLLPIDLAVLGIYWFLVKK